MGKLLLLLFTIVPLAELYLLLLLGRLMGFWSTVVLVLVTGVLGAALAKSEGLRVLRQWQAALTEGRMPEEGVLGGLLVLVGGVLLITPGVLTDVTGLLLLFPPTRRLVAAFVMKRLERRIREGSVRVVTFSTFDRQGPFAPRDVPVTGAVIDVDGEEVVERPALPPSRRPSDA